MNGLLQPNRAAYAAIRGYLYQAAVGVERWLDLGDDEILLCEGDEDLDKKLLAGGASESEQLKSYSGRLGWGSKAVAESVVNFLRAFVTLRQRGEQRTFFFTTTAELEPRSKGFDVLGSWDDPARRDEVIAAIRERVATAAADEVTWLDAEPARWTELVTAVRWRFGAPQLDDVQRDIERKVGDRFGDNGTAELIASRLLAECLHAHSQADVRLRVLTRDRLLAVLAESRAQLDAWAAGQERVHLDALRDGLREELKAHDLELEEEALATLLHSGRDPIPNDSPAALLRAGAEVVSFTRRVEELKALDDWLESDAPAAVWLWIGGGGTGKTRLFVEWVKRLRARGVRAGFLKKEVTDLTPLFGALGPRIVVVDYAENRLAELHEILGRLAEEDGDGRDERGRYRPFRLVLLARGVGEWWEGLGADDYRCGALVANHGRVSTLAALVPETEDRQALYERALHELAAARPPATALAPAPSLNGPHFAQGLYVLMAALAALAGKSLADADDLLDFMLEHERRYWLGAAKDLELAGALKNAFAHSVERSVVLLTLWGGRRDRAGVRNVVECAARLPAGQDYLLDELVEVLQRLYGGDHGTRGLEPDLIGEHLVQRALEREAAPILKAVVDDAGVADATSLLTVLDRLAGRRPEAVEWLRAALRLDLANLAMPAIDVALATGDPAGVVLAEVLEEADPLLVAAQIVKLVDDRYKQTVVLRETAAIATRIVLDACRCEGSADPDAAAETARLASNLGVRLGDLGRREAALESAQEAVEIYRQLAKQRPDAFLPDLAMSLNNLGNSLSDLGRREAALESAQEAVGIRRQLAEQRPDAFLPDLASSLNNLGNRLSELGRREAALESAQEAAEIYRQLAEQRPDAFLPNLAMTLSNLGNRLGELGRREAALEAVQEAVEILRQLAKQRPDAFLPNLATSLISLGTSLSDLGRREAALEAAQKAVEIYRRLAEQRPGAFLPNLAMSLNNLGSSLSELGRREAALEAAQEAVEIYLQLAKQRPDAFLPDLAMSLNNLGNSLSDLGRREAALESAQEAVEIRRQLAEQRPDAFLPDLASSLNNLGIRLSELGRWEAALEAGREAVETRRQLAEQRPDAFLPKLAMSLGALGSILKRVGDDSTARDQFAAGIRALGPLFLRSPAVHGRLMRRLVRDYVQTSHDADLRSDEELLAPILAAMPSEQHPDLEDPA